MSIECQTRIDWDINRHVNVRSLAHMICDIYNSDWIFAITALFSVSFKCHLCYNVINMDVRQLRANTTKYPEIVLHISARFYGNAHKQS